MSKQPIPIRKNSVVNLQIFQNLYNSKRRAGQDGLLALRARFGIEEADVLIHVEDVSVTEALDIFTYVDDLLEVLILAVVEDRVVDDDSVNVRVVVGRENGLFDVIARRGTEGIAESTVFEDSIST